MHFRRAIELDKENFGAYGRLAEVYEAMGDYQQALQLNEEVNRVREASQPHSALYSVAIIRLKALMGKRDAAMKAIEKIRLDRNNRGGPEDFMGIAATYAALGEKDKAFQWLENAVARRDLIVFIKEDPKLDSLHSDPRWADLLRRIKFPSP